MSVVGATAVQTIVNNYNSWVAKSGHVGHGTVRWWIRWVAGHEMWPIISSGVLSLLLDSKPSISNVSKNASKAQEWQREDPDWAHLHMQRSWSSLWLKNWTVLTLSAASSSTTKDNTTATRNRKQPLPEVAAELAGWPYIRNFKIFLEETGG